MLVGVVREGSAGGTAGKPGKEEDEVVILEASGDFWVSDVLRDIWSGWLVVNRFTLAESMF